MQKFVLQAEKDFQKQKAYKRSKRYYDMEKVKEEEHQGEVQRRKPQPSMDTIDTRVDTSFIFGIQGVDERLKRDIDHHQKYVLSRNASVGEKPPISIPTPKLPRIKYPNMSKMLSRHEVSKMNPTTPSEDRFNNFYFSSPENKLISWNNQQNKTKQPENPEKSTQKLDKQTLGRIYEKNIYDSCTTKCLFSYQKKKQHIQKSPSPPKPIPTARLKLSQEKTKKKIPVCAFYRNTSRSQASPLHYKKLKRNEFEYESQKDKKIEGEIKLRKQIMIDKRLSELMSKKKIKDIRSEMCDVLFFRRNPV